jgi:predicted transposase/invertase (TIGR01784 family)
MRNRSNPKSDRVFKHIFHNCPRALIHLLNSFLPLQHPIVEIEYLPEELHDDAGKGRLGIVDVRCRDSVGRHFIVEMQIQNAPMMLQRLVWNAARVLSRQMERGGPFRGIQPVHTLCLLDHPFVVDEQEWIHHYSIRPENPVAPRMEGLFFTIVELRKWVKIGNFEKHDHRDAWMMFFTKPEAMLEVYTPEERQKLRELFEAVNAWDLTRYTVNELWRMDKEIDNMLTHEYYAEWYYEQGMEKGIRKGKEIGLEMILEIVSRFKSDPAMTDEFLQSEYNISAEEIERIRFIAGINGH